ncbi:hypothetical protein EGW08_015676, partial [Elysia chlorotica]
YKKPVGQIQSDYRVKRDWDYDDYQRGGRPPARAVGQVQSDFYQSRADGPRAEIDDSPINISMGNNPRKQSKSFKVLQWMTETEHDDDQEDVNDTAQTQTLQRARRKHDPERRHNADDDEMRFSGLHSKADIPSKAFGRLQKMPMDSGPPTAQNGQDAPEDSENGVGNYDETSIRYKGKHIPSPSFRVLQTWAEYDPDPVSEGAGTKKDDDSDDDLPETLDGEDVADKRYKGGNIPSRLFKHLQKTVGDDTPETPAPAPSVPTINVVQGPEGSATDF